MTSHDADSVSTVVDVDRRASVLESALLTFARFGYRRTSMEEVALAAHISRPGLYFLFASKESLFRAAATQALERDLAAVERALTTAERPLRDRLLDAFDAWAGRYVGPLSRDISVVIEDNPALLGDIVETAPRRFEALVMAAVLAELGSKSAVPFTQTLISTSIGIKHQVAARKDYVERLAVALDLLLR